ncbi:Cacna1i [Symbiodinium microadriaticum]|nr:Cacna1i [Symbiodinium microadriaticum]
MPVPSGTGRGAPDPSPTEDPSRAFDVDFSPSPEGDLDRGPRISEEFRDLVERLVQQHVTELSEYRTESGRYGHIQAPAQPKPSRLKNRKLPQRRRSMNAEDVLTAWDNEYNNDNGNMNRPFSVQTTADFSESLTTSKNTKSSKGAESGPPVPYGWRRRPTFEEFQEFLQSSKFEILMTSVLGLHVLWMAMELQLYGSLMGLDLGILEASDVTRSDWHHWETGFRYGDTAFTVFFTMDVVIRVSVLKLKFWKVCLNYVDVAVTVASLFELTSRVFLLPVNPVLFRLLRIFKLARALRMVTMTSVLSSLQLLIKCLMASIDMLFWTFCLLTFLQCVAGMIVSTLCRDFIENPEFLLATREEVYRYYGSFTRTFLTMFEILFANWAPPCRVLVDNVSEWFSLFFLVYRCIIGFAVLNVVNAVFVQQTMKTASFDEELAFKQKERDVITYTNKVRRLFQTMDETGDGTLNFEEFSKLVTSPKLKFWMSQLELDYHDLLSLFEFLDNGDGEITLSEFIEGATRLRGQAKALDVWRLETKVELLFEDILGRLNNPENGSAVQAIFNHSSYKHITTARRPSSMSSNNQEEGGE